MTMKSRQTKTKQATTLLATIVGLVMTSVMIAPIEATDYYTGNKWGTTSVDTCYSSNLNNLNINGATNRFSTVAAQIDAARNDWNDEPSVFTFNNVSSCSHWHLAASLGSSSGTLAITYKLKSGTTITDNDTQYNQDVNWTTTNTCSWPPYYLKSVATHELGHWLELTHYSGTNPSYSVMYPSYNCAGTSVTAHDSSTLTAIYG